jgi:signal transduction histidine kinase
MDRMRSSGEATTVSGVLSRPSRLAAVERARALLASSQVPLERLARLVASGGHAPIGAISLLDATNEYLVAAHGVRERTWPVSLSMCQYVISADLPLVVDDIDQPGGQQFPPAIRAAGIGAYAGYPVYLDGAAVGAVCVVDEVAHHWSTAELNAVSDAASVVTAMLAEHDEARESPGQTLHDAMRDAAGSRSFIDALLGSLDTAVVACDLRGHLILFNPHMRRISGDIAYTTPDRWPGRHDTYHPDGRPMRTEELPLMRALLGEEVHSAPMLIRRDGEPDQHYLCNGRQLRSDDGEVLGAVMAVHEVTGMVRDSRFKDCEVAVARVLEYEPPLEEAAGHVLNLVVETLGWPWAELWLREGAMKGAAKDLRRLATASLHEDGQPPAPGHALARSACEEGRAVWAPTNTGEPGTKPTLAVPIRSAERVLGVLTLFADRVDYPAENVERLLSAVAAHVGMFLERRRGTQLAQALAASKDEYIGLVGHEMRTPLTSISAYTDLVIDDPELSDDARQMLSVVQRNAATLRGIIANLLDLAAFDSGHVRVQLNPTDVSDLVRAITADAVEKSAKAREATPIEESWSGRGAPPALSTEIQTGLRVAADAPRLRQAVENLLGNALTYTPGNGSVVVRLEAVNGEAVLDIADTGIGIPPDERPKLFGRFFRGRAAKGAGVPGSGLGLAISRAIVEAHNGRLELVDRPAPGSTFRVRLPLA